jgi:hypothetical protein
MVGDRSMITSARVDAMNQARDGTARPDPYRWITASRAPVIRLRVLLHTSGWHREGTPGMSRARSAGRLAQHAGAVMAPAAGLVNTATARPPSRPASLQAQQKAAHDAGAIKPDDHCCAVGRTVAGRARLRAGLGALGRMALPPRAVRG